MSESRRPRDDGGWVLRESRVLFESPWYKLRQDELTLPSGAEITYTLVDHPGYVMVVPLLDDGTVVMERVYRHTVQRTLLECPSGGLEGRDADPAAAARRELEEETGYRARELCHLGRFVGSSGISNEEYDVYLATGLTEDGRMQREETEQMEIERIDLRELRTRALAGEIEDAPTVLAILLACERIAGDPLPRSKSVPRASAQTSAG